MEGEAVFKVTKSDKTPFIVKTKSINVKVYVTVFNVSAYNDEEEIKTTLAEGSIGINILNDISSPEIKIKPGQQNIYNKIEGNTETIEVDAGQYLAWAEGMFAFENKPVEDILKIMSRWYTFDYEIAEPAIKNQRFTFSISKYENALKIFEMMTASSNLKFNLIEQYNNETVNLKNASVDEALQTVLKGKKLQFKKENEVIIIEPLPEDSSKQKPTAMSQTIKGNIYDIETGIPLYGATVVVPLPELPAGTATDQFGNYKISI